MDVATSRGGRARSLGLTALTVFAGYLVLIIYGDDEPVTTGSWVFVGVTFAVAALVWLFAVAGPLGREAGNTPAKVGLVIGIVALLSNVMFWIGFNGFLGAAAIVLGVEGSRRAQRGEGRAGMAKAATILGLISVVAFAGILIAWGISELF